MTSRRSFLAGTAAAVGVAACGRTGDGASPPTTEPGAPATDPGAPPGEPALASPPGTPARFVPRAGTGRPKVALTFHFGGGTEATVGQLLGLLADQELACTLFAVGSWLEQNPRFTQRAVDAGHELANHTWSHGEMGQMAAAEVAGEITRAAAVLTERTGSDGRWFRPSAMDVPTPLVLEQAGAAGYPTVVGYDIDSRDFRDVPASEVVANCSAATAGSIVSLHFGHANTIEALPAVVDDLRRRQLDPVTVATLLA